MPAPRSLLLGLALLACNSDAKTASNGSTDTAPAAPAAPVVGVEVVRRWPHDPGAYTQGLEIVDSVLYEGTGIEGQSSVRIVDLATGAVRKKVDLPRPHFGEGITVLGGKLYQITWKSQRAFVYDAATLRQTGTFTYQGEGWGLTNDGRSLIMSNGSDTLVWRDPATFKVTRAVAVTDRGLPVTQLNELELVNGLVYANVWQARTIARIDPATGQVKSWIETGELLTSADRAEPVDVLNGIAYDRAKGRLFLTGKYWPAMFEVKIKEGN